MKDSLPVGERMEERFSLNKPRSDFKMFPLKFSGNVSTEFLQIQTVTPSQVMQQNSEKGGCGDDGWGGSPLTSEVPVGHWLFAVPAKLSGIS